MSYLDFASSSLACINTFFLKKKKLYFTFYSYDILSTFLDPYVFQMLDTTRKILFWPLNNLCGGINGFIAQGYYGYISITIIKYQI